MARALGLPARVAVGLVYLRGAFYYHAWPEVYVAQSPTLGQWLPVDPTLNQFPADATHVRLARTFWPGPLTIVVPAKPAIARELLGGGSTIAIRVPAHQVAAAVAAELGFCITSTSANRSGQVPATTAEQVAIDLGDAIDLVLDGGPSPGGPPSTIVEFAGNVPKLIRAGAVPWERVLESLL